MTTNTENTPFEVESLALAIPTEGREGMRPIKCNNMHMKALLLSALLFLVASAAIAGTIRGKVLDQQQEPLIGAHISITENNSQTVAGLDGSFQLSRLQPGHYRLQFSYIGHEVLIREITINAQEDIIDLVIELKASETMLSELVINGDAAKGSEREARLIEQHAVNTMNAISAKAIALSPDISVANVVQRVSGLTIERNSSGDPQYAIVRGMDKRYNYTLVNGVKISSPDNKNRYIPLDIFPASLLERLEVHKSLSPTFEGDAIGGVVNMVMKSAPQEFELLVDMQAGYNHINTQHGFNSFNSSGINHSSPLERFGPGFNAGQEDFTRRNLQVANGQPLPDLFGTISMGGRLFQDKLGILAAASFQNAYRGTESVWFDYSLQSNQENLVPSLDKMQERFYNTRQTRNGYHINMDFLPARGHKINWYNGYYVLNDEQVRTLTEYRLGGGQTNPATGNAEGMKQETRTRLTEQAIFNSTLSGQHVLVDNVLEADWSAVYSKAERNRPDNAQFNRITEMRDFVVNPSRVAASSPRRWEYNNDIDYTGYLNFSYRPQFAEDLLHFKTGGMYRRKNRDNFFNEYYFAPNNPPSMEGRDWNTYGDVDWRIINPRGTSTDPLNYEARENILAYYLQTGLQLNRFQATGGIRVEHTEQGYTLKRPGSNQNPDTTQRYADILPSLHLKYLLKENMNLRAGYFYGISRPGFFEIVPYRILDEDYDERGNPDLQRVKAHSVDMRWEYFPNPTDQILLGAFYKEINDPIEYALVPYGANNSIVLMPGNFGTAHNWGFEIDYTRFFQKIGIRGNYTFTNSTIASVKSRVIRENAEDPTSQLITVNETENRPLQGQARHIGNVSLLYKDIARGTDMQLAFIYTGERLENVSPFYKNDSYALPILQVDLSVDQRIFRNTVAFFKANNLLNSAYKVVVKGSANPAYEAYRYQDNIDRHTLIRRDQYYQSFRLGFRWEI